MVCGQCGDTNPDEAALCMSCSSLLVAEPIRYDAQAATVVDYSMAPTRIEKVSTIATDEILDLEPQPSTGLMDTVVQRHPRESESNGSRAPLARVASVHTDPLAQPIAVDLLCTHGDAGRESPDELAQTDERRANTVPHDGQLTDTVPSKGQLTDAVPSKGQLTDAVPSKGQLTDTVPHALMQTVRATPEQLAEMVSQSKTTDPPQPETSTAKETDPVAQVTPEPRPTRPAPPAQPARRLIRVVMALFGLGLLGIFAAGLLVGGMPSDLVATVRALPFRQLYLALAGVMLLLAAVVPLPYMLRGALAASLGIVPLAFMLVDWQLDWRRSATLVAMVLLPAALLHRARHPETIFARVVIAIGIGALLAPLLVPSGGIVPAKQLLTGLQMGPFSQLAPRLYPLVVALLCLLCLLPLLLPRRNGLARLWALVLLIYLPVQVWLEVALSVSSVGEAISSRLTMLTGGLALFVFLTITAMGLAHITWSLSGAAKRAEVVPPA